MSLEDKEARSTPKNT